MHLNSITTSSHIKKQHQKVIGKGIPVNAIMGIANQKQRLPTFPVTGITKHGNEVELKVHVKNEEIWLHTLGHTEKIPFISINNIITEPIFNFEQYCIMGIQLGCKKSSIFWIYWIPAQYMDAIKRAVIGTWDNF